MKVYVLNTSTFTLTKILVFLFLCENDYVDINYVSLEIEGNFKKIKVQLLYLIKLNVIDHI